MLYCGLSRRLAMPQSQMYRNAARPCFMHHGRHGYSDFHRRTGAAAAQSDPAGHHHANQPRSACAGNSKVWDPPSPGEHVILFAPGGDLAGTVVLASLDSQQNPLPSTSSDDIGRVMPDASRFAYDHAAGALTITGIKTLLVDAQDSITLKVGNHISLDALQTTSTGRHTVEGWLTYLVGMAGHSGAQHSTIITGDITHIQTA